MNADLSQDLVARLSELRAKCADMRFGQMLATLAILAEDMTGRSMRDIEDEELLGVLERFRQDSAGRAQSVV